MSSERRFWVGGNWKMNGSTASIAALIATLNEAGPATAGVHATLAPGFQLYSHELDVVKLI